MEGEIKTVFVGNLSFGVSHCELKQLFSNVGGIEDIRIIKGVDGREKGFAFVEFESAEKAKKALENNGILLAGRPANISLSYKTKYNQKIAQNSRVIGLRDASTQTKTESSISTLL